MAFEIDRLSQRVLISFFVALLLSLSGVEALHAQDEGVAQAEMPAWPPKPASQLKKFERFIGHWRGEGTSKTPMGDAKWSSTSTCSWELDGHVFREDTMFEFEPAMPGKFIWSRYVAWDPNRKRYFTFSFSNAGEFDVADHLVWVGDDAFVVMMTRVVGAQLRSERSVIRFTGDDAYSITWERATGAESEASMRVDGTYKKVDKGYTIDGDDWNNAFMSMPAPEPMQKLHGMAGTYAMTGSISMFPGAPAMPISSTERARSIFGGMFMKFKSTGNPSPMDPSGFVYRGMGFTAWDAESGCYRQCMLSNMGEAGVQDLRFVDDGKSLVSAMAVLDQGQPAVIRTTLTLDDEGRMAKATVDRMAGVKAAEEMFVGEYEPAESSEDL